MDATGTRLVTVGDRAFASGDLDARYPVYSVTKPAIAAACLLLDLDLSARVRVDGGEEVTLEQLLTHTSGLPDYGRLPEYHAAVAASPSEPWSDDELLARALAAGRDFPPGSGWAYSNTGYLLLRRLLDERGGLAALLPRLGLAGATVAEEPADLADAVPATSAKLGEGVHPVAGRYHPAWVGHRTLVASARGLHRFWSRPPAAFLDRDRIVPVGFDVPGVVRAGYGLGVTADLGHPAGLAVGHGGGGPGYSAAVLAVPGADAVAVVLEAREDFPAQETARELLDAALGLTRPAA